MDLVPLPPKSGGSPEHPTGSGSGASDQTIRRYMSTRAAWVLSLDLGPLPEPAGESSNGDRALSIPKAAFGGHVYSQSGLAACLAVEEDEMEKGKPAADVKTGLHVRTKGNLWRPPKLWLTDIYPDDTWPFHRTGSA